MATDLTLTFNAEAWTADDDGNTMAVEVYRAGADGMELSKAPGVYGDFEIKDADDDGISDTMIVHNLWNSEETDCGEQVYVIAANLCLAEFNSLAVTAQSQSLLNIPEKEVLHAYVSACDPSYSYRVRNTLRDNSRKITAYVLEMTSGVWRGAQEVDQPTWRHFITVVEPDNVTSRTAMLIISGGSTGNEPSAGEATLMIPFAVDSGSIVALIQAVPNEPLTFSGETASRTEDEIIAYSYSKYMDSFEKKVTDMTWPLLLPMTRAAVRGMDTLQDYMANKPSGSRVIDEFVVAGASKRGWTTWLTAAADDRVMAIVPIVIDVLNMDKQIAHQKKAYSNYSFDDTANRIYHGYSSSVQAYVKANVFQRFGKVQATSLLKIVDPITYKDVLTMPKLISNSTGDQFFLPDSSQFYLSQLSGQNFLRYAPNTDHSLTQGLAFDRNTLSTLEAFYIAQVRNSNAFTTDDVVIPRYTWKYQDDTVNKKARIVVTSKDAPTAVKLWQASNGSHRDFRLETLGAAWTSTALKSQCELDCEASADPTACTCDSEALNQVFTGEVDIPVADAGWRGFFVEMTYPGPDPNLPDVFYTFTTPVRVVPDVYPSN